jgi:hypothetical protein
MWLDSIDGPAQALDRAGGGFALFVSFVGIKLLIVNRPFELIDCLVLLAQTKIGISEVFMERISIRRHREYPGKELRRANEVAALAQRISKRCFIFRIFGFGLNSCLELPPCFFVVAKTLRQLAKAEPPLRRRIKRNSIFQLASRLTRPP